MKKEYKLKEFLGSASHFSFPTEEKIRQQQLVTDIADLFFFEGSDPRYVDLKSSMDDYFVGVAITYCWAQSHGSTYHQKYQIHVCSRGTQIDLLGPVKKLLHDRGLDDCHDHAVHQVSLREISDLNTTHGLYNLLCPWVTWDNRIDKIRDAIREKIQPILPESRSKLQMAFKRLEFDLGPDEDPDTPLFNASKEYWENRFEEFTRKK